MSKLSKWWDRFSVRRRVKAIEEALWEDGRRPMSLFMRVDGPVDERIQNLNHKLDLLADKMGVRFIYENESLPFRLMKKSDYEKMRNEQEKSW